MRNKSIKKVDVSFNKIREIKTGTVIAESMVLSSQVESLSFKKCAMTLPIFSEMAKGLQSGLKCLELDSNKFGNDGLKILRGHLVMQVRSQLKSLSLYDCELQGTTAVGMITDIMDAL